MIFTKHISVFWILFIGISPFYFGQKNDITVSPLWSLNTEADEIFCTFIGDEIIIASNESDNIIDDFHRYQNNFILYQGSETEQAYQYSVTEEFLSRRVFEDIGTSYFDPINEVMWFSTAYNFNGEKGETLKIYSIKKTKRGWARPKSFKFNSEFYSVTHPWLNEDGTQLFFSSDKEGGAGGMDLWFCNLLDKNKWSEPLWLGDVINSPANEIFPTIHDGDIYYSSDQNPLFGLDIYRAFRLDQWEKKEKLRSPLNSDKDDFQLVFRDNNSGFLTSRRNNGQGGDDIYFFRIKVPPKESENLFFLLEFKDIPLQGLQILLTDEEDVILADLTTNEKGIIPAAGIDLKELKKIYVLDMDDHVISRSVLYLIDEKGEKLRSFLFGSDGYFQFEYLPLDMLGELPKLDDTDHSFLTLLLEGQIYVEEPGDIGKGEPVFITDEKGNILALSYTSEEGKFDIEELEPLKNYYFKFNDHTEVKHLQLRDRDTDLLLDVTEKGAFYARIEKDKSLRIIDENKQPIYINKNEVFIIKNFYYEFESTELNEIAKSQLSDLALILRNNPTIKIELASHTDSRGTYSFNLNLSNLRAQKAIDYLNSLGISRNRMTSVGYGEYQLINHCDDLQECTEEEHALNRRTEIKIFTE